MQQFLNESYVILVASLRQPSITTAPVSGSYSVGSKIQLSCDVEGVPTPSVTWLFNGQPSVNLPLIPRITLELTPQSRGFYSCRAQNSQGTAISAQASISINSKFVATYWTSLKYPLHLLKWPF